MGNFFANIQEPLGFLNNALQAEWRDSGINLARFGINSTLGLLGLFDPAKQQFSQEPQPEGFADTLATWGLEHGTYLVLPLIGPSGLRSSVGMVADGTLDLINEVEPPGYLREATGCARAEAVRKSHLGVGSAVLYTSVIVTLGFSTLAFSDFVPSLYFGLLTGLAMMLAVAVNLSFLPALLAHFVGVTNGGNQT